MRSPDSMPRDPQDRIVPPVDVVWTATDLGVWLHMHRKRVIRNVNTNGWPHHRAGNQYLFTAEDRAEILEMIAVRPEAPSARVRRIRRERAS